MKNIGVLLATYNGAKYLSTQIESILSQELFPDLVLIRDDDSKDKTVSILERYHQKYPSNIIYFEGEHLGVSQAFFEIIANAKDCKYYALSDQDDIWLPKKLKKAVEVLNKEDPDLPLLYIGRFKLLTKNYRVRKVLMPPVYNYTDFPHSLLYHSGPGNTFVFNEPAKKIIEKFDYRHCVCGLHDSIIHKLIAMNGKVIIDREPLELYRQHEDNAIGFEQPGLIDIVKKVKNFTSGRSKNYRSQICQEILDYYKGDISQENRELLEKVAYVNKSAENAEAFLNDERFKTNPVNDALIKSIVKKGLL